MGTGRTAGRSGHEAVRSGAQTVRSGSAALAWERDRALRPRTEVPGWSVGTSAVGVAGPDGQRVYEQREDGRLLVGPGGYRVVACRVPVALRALERDESGQGFRVCADAEDPGTRWSFAAFAPDCAPEVHWRDWPPLVGQVDRERVARAQGVHYPLGVPVPQRCALLGVRKTAAAARALCEAHRTQSAESEVV